jgi:aspartyl-tRNA(Asn)/glutamyl-tRNA(Gln) amidotransferase subunit A
VRLQAFDEEPRREVPVTDAVPDATELAKDLAEGRLSSSLLVEQTLDRIATADGSLRSFITVVADSARADASASDERRRRGKPLSALDGIPFAVKDNIAVAGVTRTVGTRAYDGERSEVDAGVVSRLRAAGAVLVGTLNMDEGALGATTNNPFWGRCENPLCNGFTPGGSSGGPAAAVAADLVPISLGTDTMGSVRIPAAYCGLWGLKPTPGLINRTGVARLSWTLDTIGPITRSLRDLLVVTSIIAATDPADTDEQRVPADWTLDAPIPTVSELHIAVPDPSFLEVCEPEVAERFTMFVSRLKRSGASVQLEPFRNLDLGKLRRAALLIAEVEGACIFEAELKTGDGLSDEFRAMLDYGRRASASRVALAYREMNQAKVTLVSALANVHGLLLPTTPQRAFPHDSPTPPNQAEFTALANAAGAPALAFPLYGDVGLPASAQLIGLPYSEGRLFAVAGTMLRNNDATLNIDFSSRN